MKIRCKKTGEVYDAVVSECYSIAKFNINTPESKHGPYHNGYYVNSNTGGNANRGWCKVFSDDQVDVVYG